jgi:hypothetical protein
MLCVPTPLIPPIDLNKLRRSPISPLWIKRRFPPYGCFGTRSVRGCIPTRSVGTIKMTAEVAIPQGLTEPEAKLYARLLGLETGRLEQEFIPGEWVVEVIQRGW